MPIGTGAANAAVDAAALRVLLPRQPVKGGVSRRNRHRPGPLRRHPLLAALTKDTFNDK
jgi:hypothetical protein